jgi:hypothetical protein
MNHSFSSWLYPTSYSIKTKGLWVDTLLLHHSVMQVQQKMCPQEVAVGLTRVLRQRLHFPVPESNSVTWGCTNSLINFVRKFLDCLFSLRYVHSFHTSSLSFFVSDILTLSLLKVTFVERIFLWDKEWY